MKKTEKTTGAEKPAHVPLPLKYRPMTFDDVVGQEHVVRTLRHAIESGHVANAYLFVGSRGIGKTTLSRIFAKALNCLSPKNGVEPCGECENCRQIAEGRSLDVVELDGASHNKVEDVRPIIEAVQFAPTVSKYKIFIIDECHMLTPAAWNALLKTLEEPPPYVRFVFATTEGDKVIATIVSRCQRFDLHRIQTAQIVSRLKHICAIEKIEIDDDALLAIARGAEGGMRDALSSLDQLVAFKGGKITEEDALSVFGLVSRQALEELAGAIFAGDHATILKLIAAFDDSGKNLRRIAAELMAHIRNLIVYQALGAKGIEATAEQLKTLEQQSKLVESARLFRIADQLTELDSRIRNALSARTLIELSLIRCSRIASTASIEELMRAVRAMRGGAAAAPRQQAYDGKPAVPNAPASRRDGGSPYSAQPSAPKAEPSAAMTAAESEKQPVNAMSRRDIVDDAKIHDMMAGIPGARISEIKEN